MRMGLAVGLGLTAGFLAPLTLGIFTIVLSPVSPGGDRLAVALLILVASLTVGATVGAVKVWRRPDEFSPA